MKPLAIDLFCGLGGFTEGLLAAGWDVVGFDVERHQYGDSKYPAQLVLQDVHTIHGRQFKDAALIVASPPCQEFSYMSMPWSRGKQIAAALRGDISPEGLKVPFPEEYTGSRNRQQLTALFDACFRIQREACEAAGRHIPMVVENVKGAQPWVGRANANYGSMYLWGDVPALMPFGSHKKQSSDGSWFYDNYECSARRFSSKSPQRKAFSAQAEKIPFALAEWIGKCYYPCEVTHGQTYRGVQMAPGNVSGIGR